MNLSSGFENAITFENEKCVSDIAYCAYDGFLYKDLIKQVNNK